MAIKVFNIISNIQEVLENSKTNLFSGGRVLVDRKNLEELLRELSDSMEPDLVAARDLLTQTDEIRAQADDYKRKTVSEANAEAEHVKRESDMNLAKAQNDTEKTCRDMLEQATAKSNEMMNQAAEHANRRVAAADEEAKRLVSTNEITLRAQARAAEIEEKANREADELRRRTMQELSDVLLQAENVLGGQLNGLRSARQQLTGGYAAPEAEYPETVQQ